jgi:hypothetical protein
VHFRSINQVLPPQNVRRKKAAPDTDSGGFQLELMLKKNKKLIGRRKYDCIIHHVK